MKHPVTMILAQIGFISIILSGCAGNTTLTEAEIERQSQADSVVSATLFEKELDTLVSYNIRKSGYVVIRFDDSVSSHEYTEVVDRLRKHEAISGVRAEQGGNEVCPLQQ